MRKFRVFPSWIFITSFVALATFVCTPPENKSRETIDPSRAPLHSTAGHDLDLSDARPPFAGADGLVSAFHFGTRSISACDPTTSECGIAVATYPAGPAGVVDVGQPGVIVANQAYSHYVTAKAIVDAVSAGMHPTIALENALASDPDPDHRQLGVAALWHDSPSGVAVATFAGANIPDEWCTGTGDTYTVQADGQTSSAVCQAMADSFETIKGSLARRLLAALKAGTAAGRDARGEYFASVRVFSNTSMLARTGITNIGPDAAVYRDADWQDNLEFNLNSSMVVVLQGNPADLVPLNAAMSRDILSVLRALGYYSGNVSREWNGGTESALREFCHRNTFFRDGAVEVNGQRLIDASLAAFIIEGFERGVLRSK